MPEFGPGAQLAAQCPFVPIPDGWRAWTDADGPVPDALAARATAIASDTTVPLGVTESYPLPGVTVLLRVEPQAWMRDASGAINEGCFRASSIFLPSEPGITPPSNGDSLSKTVGILTAASLAVGLVATVATVASRGKK